MHTTLHRLRSLHARLTPAPLVLGYHRVADATHDPWGQVVSPHNFAQQMEYLARHHTPVTLAQLTDAAARGIRIPRAVAVTFDDGYRDNADVALPILRSVGIPATFFIIAGAVGSPEPVWSDELMALLSDRWTTPELRLRIDGREHVWDISSPGEPAASPGWVVAQPPPTPRHALYLRLWGMLVHRPADVQRDVIDQFRTQAPADTDVELIVDEERLVRLAAHDGMEIGSHTVTHPNLPTIDAILRDHELRASRTRLRELTGQPIDSFAYPYGATDDACRRQVADAGYRRAVTVGLGAVRRGTPPMALPRLAVPNRDGLWFARWLSPLRPEAPRARSGMRLVGRP